MHIQNPKKINLSYNFVKKVYSLENRYNLFLNFILSLSIILFFWGIVFFIQRRFIFTKVEFIVFIILSLVPFLLINIRKRITLDSIGRRLESLLPLGGRLFLSIDEGTDRKIYGASELIKRAVDESNKTLKGLSPKDFVKKRRHHFYYTLFGISLAFLFFSYPHIHLPVKITPEYIPAYKISEVPNLITAYANTPKLYIVSKKRSYKMIRIGKERFGIYTILPDGNFYIGYRRWKKGPFYIPVSKNFKVLAMKKHYKFPRYVNIPDIIDTTQETNITGIQNTEVDFTIKVSPHPLKAFIIKKDKKIPLKVSHQSIMGKFTIQDKEDLQIDVYDSLNVPSRLLDFHIFSVKDNPPKFSFISPESPYKLGKDMQLTLKSKVEDDFSLRSAFLKTGERKTIIPDVKGKTSILSTAHFDLSNMLPGDTLRIYGIAKDAIGQIYTSQPFIVYLPHLEEMLSSISEIGKSLSDKTGDIIQSQDELKKAVEEIIDKGGIQDWEDRKTLENTLKEQEKILDKISRIKDVMKTFKNPEVQKEMEKIRELYQEMDIQKLNQEVQKAMKKGIKEKSLEKIDLSQEKLLKSLKMGRQLLEKLAKLMKMDEYYQSLMDIKKEEERIVDAAAKNPGQASEAQSKLGSKMDSLLMDMKSSKYKEIKDIGKAGEKQNISGNMEKLAKEFARGKNNKALSKKIKKALNNLIKMLENEQEREIAPQNFLKDIEKIVLGLRFILYEVDGMYENPHLRYGIIEALNHIYRRTTYLFLKSMAFSPLVLSDLSEVISSIKGNARIEPIKYKIENIIIMLLDVKRKGKPSLLNALMSMLQQQEGIGEKMQALIPMPVSQRKGGLKKMAAQERSLAKRMGELGDAFSSIAEEMQALASQLEQGRLTKRELQMHKKILRHLLEAERSVRRRSFAKKRRSSPGKYYPSPKIKVTQDKGERYYYERLLIEKFKDEPVSDAFKRAVKDYYERILK